MSNLSQEVKGTAEQVVGNVQKRAGEFIGDAALQSEGETRQALGRARFEVAAAVGRVKGKVQRAAQAVLDGISTVAGSTATQRTNAKTVAVDAKVPK